MLFVVGSAVVVACDSAYVPTVVVVGEAGVIRVELAVVVVADSAVVVVAVDSVVVVGSG